MTEVDKFDGIKLDVIKLLNDKMEMDISFIPA